MKLLFLVCLLPLTAWAQWGIEQPFFFQPSASTPSYSPTNEALLRYWWVASDLPTNTAVTNWVDRIAGVAFTNTAASGPTNSATGIGFSGSKKLLMKDFWLSVVNTTGTVCVVCTPQSGNVIWASNPAQNYSADYGLWLSGNNFHYWGSGDADVASYSAGVTMDILFEGNSAATCNFFTNGVLSKNTSLAMPGYMSTIGRGTGDVFYNGKIQEILVFSGVLNSTSISNVHSYETNTYKFSP